MKLDLILLTRSYIFALASGAEKLFYVNLRLPQFFPSQAKGLRLLRRSWRDDDELAVVRESL